MQHATRTGIRSNPFRLSARRDINGARTNIFRWCNAEATPPGAVGFLMYRVEAVNFVRNNISVTNPSFVERRDQPAQSERTPPHTVAPNLMFDVLLLILLLRILRRRMDTCLWLSGSIKIGVKGAQFPP